ncbi:hypothetical protein Leryth_001113 [Lithospermum erythrorhizon]|nr:hypothetical protein Leryth_001113 [Lithospermum erythrorhizon]
MYTANIKRKRPPARRGGHSRQGIGGEDDDEDDNDEDYKIKARLSASGRRNTRASRQTVYNYIITYSHELD